MQTLPPILYLPHQYFFAGAPLFENVIFWVKAPDSQSFRRGCPIRFEDRAIITLENDSKFWEKEICNCELWLPLNWFLPSHLATGFIEVNSHLRLYYRLKSLPDCWQKAIMCMWSDSLNIGSTSLAQNSSTVWPPSRKFLRKKRAKKKFWFLPTTGQLI